MPFGQWQQLKDGTWELHTTDGRELVAEVGSMDGAPFAHAYGPSDAESLQMQAGTVKRGAAGRAQAEGVARELWGLA